MTQLKLSGKISEGKFFHGRKRLELQEGAGWSTACAAGSPGARSRASRSPTSPGRQTNAGLAAHVEAKTSKVTYRGCWINTVFLKTQTHWR